MRRRTLYGVVQNTPTPTPPPTPTVNIYVLEIQSDAPYDVYGNSTISTSLGYTLNGSHLIIVDPPILLSPGNTVSAQINGEKYSNTCYGTAPNTEGNYTMFIDGVAEKIEFYYK